MPRLVIAALSSLMLLGFCVYSVVTTYIYPSNAPLKGPCDAWLERPVPRWVALNGCVLDVDLVILESDQGDFEKLVNRQKGIGLKPYRTTPNWVAAWLPVRTQWTQGLVRAAYRTESKDLVKWINALERASEQEKDRMWNDAVLLRRFSRPGVLPGLAEKPTGDGLQKAFGAAASVNMLVVIAGEPPPARLPALGIFAGLAGLMLLGYFITQSRGGHLHETAEQHLTKVNVSDVKLEIGGLEELRAEEKGKKRKID
ncbi:MAG: hypothetical protein Q8L48_02220 [Archangium sp.]|nr:hypothetical protein [Archangium sp.]